MTSSTRQHTATRTGIASVHRTIDGAVLGTGDGYLVLEVTA
jgi:hypothetical protein